MINSIGQGTFSKKAKSQILQKLYKQEIDIGIRAWGGYLQDEVGIEPDLADLRDNGIDKRRPEIDESVGGQKTRRHRRFPWQSIVLRDSA